MPRPVRHAAHEPCIDTHEGAHPVYQFPVRAGVRPSDIVNLAHPAATQDQLQGAGMVHDEKPVPDVAPVPIEGKILPVQPVRNHERQGLLGILIGAEIIGGAGDDRGQAVGDHIGAHQQIRCRLGGRVRAVGLQPVVLARPARGHAAVDLVGRNMHEAADLMAQGRVQKDLCAHHVGAYEGRSVQDRAVHVRLGREVDHGVGARHAASHRARVRDVALDPAIPAAAVAHDIGKVGRVTRVGEQVEIDDADLAVGGKHMPDEIRADESQAARDEQTHQATFVLCLRKYCSAK